MQTLTRKQMLQVLSCIQNEFSFIDIITIVYCRPAHTDEQLSDHIWSYFRRLSKAAKAEVLEFAQGLAVAA